MDVGCLVRSEFEFLPVDGVLRLACVYCVEKSSFECCSG